MRPKKPETTGSTDLFRARLDQIINLKHELAQLAGKIDWDWIDDEVAPLYSAKGRPGIEGSCQNFCVRPVSHHEFTKRSLNMTANWVFASAHSRGGRFHSAAAWFKTRYSSFVAASSDGKCPLVRTARRSFEFNASMAFVV